MGVLGGCNHRQVDRQQQAAADVAVGKAPAAYVVQQFPGRNVGQEGVVEDEAAGKPDVGDDEHGQKPEPGLAGVGREEHQQGSQRPDDGINPQQGFLDGHPVGDYPQHRAGQGDQGGGKGDAQAPGRAAGEGEAQEGNRLAQGVLEQEDEIDREDGGPAGGGVAGVGPVIHTPGPYNLALLGRQVAQLVNGQGVSFEDLCSCRKLSCRSSTMSS